MNGNRFDKDFYKVLGVAENASAAEIKRAYRKLAQQHHPDRNPNDRAAEETMKTISEAYDTLSDPKRRAEYDQMRRMARTGGFHAPGGYQDFATEGGFDLGDIFGSLFGRGGGRGRAATASGPDLEAEARITFEQAMEGVTVPVRVQRDAACDRCGGTGAEPGSKIEACPTCRGTGVVGDDQGPFTIRRPCGTCGGSGRIVEKACARCGGDGSIRRTDEVKVRIPAGVNDGARIRARGWGGAGPRGGTPGDLYVQVRVGEHPVFGRNGADLTLDLPVSFAEATLGAEIAVPTLDGPVTLKVPAGTQPGRTFRIKGRGAPKTKGGRGDVLATVRVVVPQAITSDERELLEQLKSKQNGAIRSHLGV